MTLYCMRNNTRWSRQWTLSVPKLDIEIGRSNDRFPRLRLSFTFLVTTYLLNRSVKSHNFRERSEMDPTCSKSYQINRPKRKRQPGNPLAKGILSFCEHHPPNGFILKNDNSASRIEDVAAEIEHLSTANEKRHDEADTDTSTLKKNLHCEISVSDLPKRYTIYPPLLLLPHNFPTHSQQWAAFYESLNDAGKVELFRHITEHGFRKMGISRVAINAPISVETETGEGENNDNTPENGSPKLRQQQSENIAKHENVLRSPSGLVPVYGDWGIRLSSLTPGERSRLLHYPATQDFGNAFWTSTSQHEGITQCWAPLYTMFSRGNVSEKARILGLQSSFLGLTTDSLGHQEEVGNVDVVDFYVGIGYFAFCYLKRGVRRVYGWDINPWSIEGLRRGCEKNGWKCLVIKVDGNGDVEGGLQQLVERIREGERQRQAEDVIRCVAFLGDNRWTAKVMEELETESLRMRRPGLNVRHANLGLLPTSKDSWLNAIKILVSMSERRRGGWAHIHENVDVRKIENMTEEIAKDVDGLIKSQSGSRHYDVSILHVEHVKTYAPGVMHCVFDTKIESNG